MPYLLLTKGGSKLCFSSGFSGEHGDGAHELALPADSSRALIFFLEGRKTYDCSRSPDCPIPHTRVRERTHDQLSGTAADTSFLLCCQCRYGWRV